MVSLENSVNEGSAELARKSRDIAAVVLAALPLLGFAALSFRGPVDPQTAAAGSGRR